MKLLFIILFSIGMSLVHADSAIITKTSWVKAEPKGKNLFKLQPSIKVDLISNKKVNGYYQINYNGHTGWVYYSRLRVTKDFPLVDCGQYSPLGIPTPTTQITLICREFYTIGYDEAAKIPNWVAYKVSITNSHSANVSRADAFFFDPAIGSANQATDDDYAQSGYDRGHMAGSASLDANRVMNDSTYVYTNMTPQLPGFNRNMMGYKGVWGKLESVVRSYAYERDLLVISGASYTNNSKTIGKGVIVPDAFYKIIMSSNLEFIGAFWLDHVEGGANDWQSKSVSIDYIEGKVNLDFFPNSESDLFEQHTIKF